MIREFFVGWMSNVECQMLKVESWKLKGMDGNWKKLLLEREIFLSEEADSNCDNSDEHLGWSRVDTTNFDKEF